MLSEHWKFSVEWRHSIKVQFYDIGNISIQGMQECSDLKVAGMFIYGT